MMNLTTSPTIIFVTKKSQTEKFSKSTQSIVIDEYRYTKNMNTDMNTKEIIKDFIALDFKGAANLNCKISSISNG